MHARVLAWIMAGPPITLPIFLLLCATWLTMPPSCILFNEDGLSVLGFIDLSAYYSGLLQKKPIIPVVAKKSIIPDGCKKAYYSGWLQKTYYSWWFQKSLLFPVVAKKPTIPGGCKKSQLIPVVAKKAN
jgi:hypothetical protein